MNSVNLREAKKIISMSIDIKQPVILLGSPGIGKTAVVEQPCEEKNIGFLCYEAPSIDPMDVRGCLIPNGEKSYFTKSPLLPDTETDGSKGVLLIDELPSGLPATQVALHPLFHPKERRLGKDKLPDGWVPMATGNYASNGAGAYKLLTAISDRMLMLNVVADYQIWKEDFAIKNNINPSVIGFLNERGDLFDTFEKRDSSSQEKSFASPRGYELASNVLNYHEKHSLSDNELLSSLCGYLGSTGTQLFAFNKVSGSLPDVTSIFHGEDIVPDKENPSLLFNLCSRLVYAVNSIDMPRQKAINRLLEYSFKLHLEFGGLLIRDLYADDRNKRLMEQSEWFPKISKRLI